MHIRQRHAFKSGALQQDFKFKALAFGIHQAPIPHYPARFTQQRQRTAQPFAIISETIGFWQAIFFGEYTLRHAAAILVQDFKLAPFRQAAGSEIGIGEIGFGARIGAIEQIDIHPFIVKNFNQRAAHPRILK